MTPYDVAMLAVVVAGMGWGFWRGMIWQVASLGSLVLGYTAAHVLSGQLAPSFPGPPVIARGLAMLVTYGVTAGGIFLVAWLARETLRQWKFEAYDRHMGLVLGGLEGALLGIVATLFVTTFAPQTRGPVFASPTGKVVGQFMDAVGPVLPSELRTALTPHWNGDAGEVAVAHEAPEPQPQPQPEPEPKNDSAAPPETVGDLVRQTERRVGQAVADEARKEIRDVLGDDHGRDVERR